MISVAQLAAALYGVWLLLKLDPRALDYFEKTPGGFARSFLPALVLAPLYLLHNVLIYAPSETKLALGPYLVVQVLSQVIDAAAFPFAMLYVTPLLHRAPRFLAYIVPYNWFQLPVGVATASLYLLADAGVISSDFAEYSNLLILMLYFTFGAFIARIGLVVGLATSIGIVMLDFLINLIAGQLIARI